MCLVKSAEAAPAPPPPEPTSTPWVFCSTCKQRFTGLVQLRLAIALWAKYARVETNEQRVLAAELYSGALNAAGEHAEAMRLKRGILDARTRMLGSEHPCSLICASNTRRRWCSYGRRSPH